jgi:hypothetical protein
MLVRRPPFTFITRKVLIFTFKFTFIPTFTDPLSVKTGLDIELVKIEAGLQHAIKSTQYNTTVVEINKTQ